MRDAARAIYLGSCRRDSMHDLGMRCFVMSNRYLVAHREGPRRGECSRYGAVQRSPHTHARE